MGAPTKGLNNYELNFLLPQQPVRSTGIQGIAPKSKDNFQV